MSCSAKEDATYPLPELNGMLNLAASHLQLIDLPGVNSLALVPLRPGRKELRAVRRRMKEYDLLTLP